MENFEELQCCKDKSKIDYLREHEEQCKEAESKGLVVNEADDYTLQLDFDQSFAKNKDLLEKSVRTLLSDDDGILGVQELTWTESKSGNTHCYVKLNKPLAIGLRIALQLYLGSDRTREFINILRVVTNSPKPIVLFEKGPSYGNAK